LEKSESEDMLSVPDALGHRELHNKINTAMAARIAKKRLFMSFVLGIQKINLRIIDWTFILMVKLMPKAVKQVHKDYYFGT